MEKIPQKPISFPANSFTVWPYHQNIEGNELVYATAQPLCVLNNEKENELAEKSWKKCQCMFINNCQLTLSSCCPSKINEMFKQA